MSEKSLVEMMSEKSLVEMKLWQWASVGIIQLFNSAPIKDFSSVISFSCACS